MTSPLTNPNGMKFAVQGDLIRDEYSMNFPLENVAMVMKFRKD